MKYFLIKDGANVVAKQVVSGKEDDAAAVVQADISKDLKLSFVEVDQDTFDGTILTPMQTQPQKDWVEAKKGGVATEISFIAKKLGLE